MYFQNINVVNRFECTNIPFSGVKGQRGHSTYITYFWSFSQRKQRRGFPTTPGCSTHSKTPKHSMQKHKADKHRKRRIRDKERQRTTQKHQTQRTTHKPTRPMGNRCRLRTAICHVNSRRCGYPGLRAHNPPTIPISQRSRRTHNYGVKQPPHC